MRFFLPKQPAFSEKFMQLNTNIKEITMLLNEFSISFNNFENYFVRAKEIEHKADDVTHEIINELNKTFITPFDREDLYELAQKMDDIVDTIERTIQIIYVYQITIKKPNVDEFVNITVKASNILDKLLIECFKQQKFTSEVNNCIIKLHELEDEGDLLYQKSLMQLFSEEKDCLTVIKWKAAYNSFEEIMDRFQHISDTIEGIIVKSN